MVLPGASKLTSIYIAIAKLISLQNMLANIMQFTIGIWKTKMVKG